jgi:hypothetical protein
VGRHVSAGPSQPGLSTIDPSSVGVGETGERGEMLASLLLPTHHDGGGGERGEWQSIPFLWEGIMPRRLVANYFASSGFVIRVFRRDPASRLSI